MNVNLVTLMFFLLKSVGFKQLILVVILDVSNHYPLNPMHHRGYLLIRNLL